MFSTSGLQTEHVVLKEDGSPGQREACVVAVIVCCCSGWAVLFLCKTNMHNKAKSMNKSNLISITMHFVHHDESLPNDHALINL